MRLIHVCLMAAALLQGLPGLAQALDQHDAAPPDTREAGGPPSAPPVHWGLGWLNYEEPGFMRLSGPDVTLQWQHRPDHPLLPERVQLDVGAALLNYDSTSTGSLPWRAALHGRATSLWHLHSQVGTWRAGLQLDLAWTDLRGTTGTGHRGYRRLGSKAWAVLQHETAEGMRIEAGALLRGRQDSLLTDAGGRDVSNTQRRGVFLAWQHPPLSTQWLSARPWARLSLVDRSDNDGRYYEPRNRTLQLGLLFDF